MNLFFINVRCWSLFCFIIFYLNFTLPDIKVMIPYSYTYTHRCSHTFRCIHICTHTSTHKLTCSPDMDAHTSTGMIICTYRHTCVYMHTKAQVTMHTYADAHMHECMQAYAHIDIHAHTHAHMHAQAHRHMCKQADTDLHIETHRHTYTYT